MKIKVSFAVLESAQLCKAKNDTRKYICGVAFMKGGRVSATNGHILFSCDKSHDGKLTDTLIISIQRKPISRYDHAVIDTGSLYINYYDVDGKMIGVGLIELIDGQYPNIDRVMNGFSPSPCDKIGFNTGYLEVIGKISKMFNPKWSSVAIQLNGSINGAVSEIGGSDGKAKLMIMPMRID